MSIITVPGLGPVHLNPHEVTSELILKEYQRLMGKIQLIFEKTTPPTQKDYEDLLQTMKELKELAEKGDSTSTVGRIYYLDSNMIFKMNVVFSLLNNQGLSIDGSFQNPNPVEAIALLRDFSTTNEKGEKISFLQLLKASTEGLETSTISLSNMIMINLIQKGNKLFLGEMLDLEKALTLSDDIVRTLTNIQSTSNQFTVPKPGGFVWPPTSADHIPPEIVEDFAKAIYKGNPEEQNTFIDQCRLYQSLPKNDSANRYSLSVTIIAKVNAYLYLGTAQERELLLLTEKHFKGVTPITNPGLPPKLNWPPISLFEGSFPFPFPLPEDLLKEMVDTFNMIPGYGDAILKHYNGMIQGHRVEPAINEFLVVQIRNFIQRDPNNNSKLQEVFQKHFDQLYPADPTLVTGGQLLNYAKQLEEYIQTLEQEPINIKRTDKDSLAYALDKVVKDIEKAFKGVDQNDPAAMAKAMERWIMDSRDKGVTGGAGAIQDNLQKAIAAAEALSDEKMNDLQEIKTTYSEFLKLAASLMEALKKSTERSAQGVSGR